VAARLGEKGRTIATRLGCCDVFIVSDLQSCDFDVMSSITPSVDMIATADNTAVAEYLLAR